MSTRDRARYTLDVVDEQRNLWDRLNVVVQGDLSRERHEPVSFPETRQDSLINGILLGGARNLLIISDMSSMMISTVIPSLSSFRAPVNWQ